MAGPSQRRPKPKVAASRMSPDGSAWRLRSSASTDWNCALGGGRHAARGAVEQLQAQPLLHEGQPFRDHGGHDLERLGRRRQAAVLPDGQQQLEVAALEAVDGFLLHGK